MSPTFARTIGIDYSGAETPTASLKGLRVYLAEGVRILELARNAQALFERQPAREKRRLLNFLLSNCTWEDGEVVATFRQPFELLAETTAIAARSSAGSGGRSAKSEIWLGDLDSNQD